VPYLRASASPPASPRNRRPGRITTPETGLNGPAPTGPPTQGVYPRYRADQGPLPGGLLR